MKPFEEAVGEDVTETVKLQRIMEQVITKCEKTVKSQGKKADRELLYGYTLEFVEKAFELQVLLSQADYNTDENIRKYNDALWEDIEVGLLEKQIAGYRLMTSAAEKETYISNMDRIKNVITEENKRKSEQTSSRSRKNLAFRYWIGDKAQNLQEAYSVRKELPKAPMGVALFPYYAFIWEDCYVPNETGVENVKCFKPAYLLSLFLGESGNTRGHSMFQAFISQVNYSYRRFTDRRRSERREDEKGIDERKREAAKDWIIGFEDSIMQLHEETVSKISRIKESGEVLSPESILLIKEICEAHVVFSNRKIGNMLDEISAINSETDEQNHIDECGKWLQENGGRMDCDMKEFVHHIWNCIEVLYNNSNDTWRRQKIFSPDLEYLKGIVNYASDNGIEYSRALVIRCLDELTDWVLYTQYLQSMSRDNSVDKEKAVRGRTDFAAYSGLALRQVSIETIDNSCVTGNTFSDISSLNRNFWEYAQDLKDKLIEILPVPKLDSNSFPPNGEFKDRLRCGYRCHDRIFNSLLEGESQELGSKESLCSFFEALYEKRLDEKYFEKN